MLYFEMLLIAVGLSVDTFAVSISTGLTIERIKFRQGIRIAQVLAFFQALLPFLGWLAGMQVTRYISFYDHWIAFGLLASLGTKMMVESFKQGEEKKYNPLVFSFLLAMAIATSIDALVVGVSLAFIETNIYMAIMIIGFVTFLASMIGMLVGKNVNGKFGRKVEFIGGLILFGIGLKILIDHLL
ncbi:MAG: manganese efflux pump [Bacteroidales bacterium]|nr:manganese efflux pump [Bacteroidales bacterium]